jgi:hypothetical protein
MSLQLDVALREIYFNVNGGYMSMEKLYQKAKKEGVRGVSRENVREWLQTQNTYIIHTPSRKHYKTQRTYADGRTQQIQMDLVDMSKFIYKNKGNCCTLTVIEVLSRYAFAIPVWRKNTESMTKAVEKVLAQFKERFDRYPKAAQFDDGKEFYNVGVKTLLKDHDVHYFSTRTFRKAALVERFNRTLKTRMWKYFTENNTKVWVDVLPALVKSYNNSTNRTIGMKPADVNEENKDKVWTRVYVYPLDSFPKSKFKVGVYVWVEIKHKTFEKDYEPNFDNEMHVITAVFRGDVYSIRDPEDGEDILGRYYEQDLSLELKNGNNGDE